MAGKIEVARRERLHRVCKSIIDNPRNVDDDVVSVFKSAALKYVATQYADTTQGLEALYHDGGELGSSLRKAVEIIDAADLDDDADRAGDIAKARDRGAGGHRSLTGALIEHLHDRLERRREQHGYQKSAKDDPPMDTLHSIMKAGGVIAVAKAITDENRSYGISEHEFVALVTEQAKAAHPELTDAAAFAKLYQIPEVWRACEVLKKSMPFVADLTLGGIAAQNEANDNTESSEAYQQLLQIGRDRWPSESEAKQFSNAISDPVNAKLASKAHRRPRATTSYPFPRA